jgi:hypothetical protein
MGCVSKAGWAVLTVQLDSKILHCEGHDWLARKHGGGTGGGGGRYVGGTGKVAMSTKMSRAQTRLME